jgi:hypothetical protein
MLSDAVHQPPAHLRLRAKSKKDVGKIFRDDTTVRANIPNLADGKDVALQVLEYPERMSRDDLVLSVRVWRPIKNELCPVVDVVIKRSTTAGQLRAFLADNILKCHHSQEELVAKACSVPSGVGLVKSLLAVEPKPTFTKLQSMKWNDAEVRFHRSILRSPVSATAWGVVHSPD